MEKPSNHAGASFLSGLTIHRIIAGELSAPELLYPLEPVNPTEEHILGQLPQRLRGAYNHVHNLATQTIQLTRQLQEINAECLRLFALLGKMGIVLQKEDKAIVAAKVRKIASHLAIISQSHTMESKEFGQMLLRELPKTDRHTIQVRDEYFVTCAKFPDDTPGLHLIPECDREKMATMMKSHGINLSEVVISKLPNGMIGIGTRNDSNTVIPGGFNSVGPSLYDHGQKEATKRAKAFKGSGGDSSQNPEKPTATFNGPVEQGFAMFDMNSRPSTSTPKK